MKRWNPLFELLFELVFELLLPGRTTPRPLTFETCDCPRPNERDGAAVLPRAEKKC